MVLRAFQELLNQTRLFKHWTSAVRDFIKHTIHHHQLTQQGTKMETMVLRALQELFNQTRLFKHWTSDVRDFIKHTIHHHQLTHNSEPNWSQWC